MRRERSRERRWRAAWYPRPALPPVMRAVLAGEGGGGVEGEALGFGAELGVEEDAAC